MSRKIKYELKCGFKYDKITLEIEAEDGETITPDELWEILKDVGEDYEELDIGSELH